MLHPTCSYDYKSYGQNVTPHRLYEIVEGGGGDLAHLLTQM